MYSFSDTYFFFFIGYFQRRFKFTESFSSFNCSVNCFSWFTLSKFTRLLYFIFDDNGDVIDENDEIDEIDEVDIEDEDGHGQDEFRTNLI